MSDSKFRVEFYRPLQSFDCLAQSFRSSPSRVISPCRVELSGFFVFTRFRVGRRERDWRGDGRDCRREFAASFLDRRSPGAQRFSISNWIPALANEFFKCGVTAQLVKLRLNSQPYNPAVPDCVGFVEESQGLFALPEMQMYQGTVVRGDIAVS